MYSSDDLIGERIIYAKQKFIKYLRIYKKMRNIIITIIILFSLIIYPKAYANPHFRAEISGFPIITENNVTANVNLTYTQMGASRLFIMSADNFITNNEDRNIKIPITNLYLLCDGEQFQISNNSWQNFYVDTLNASGSVQKNLCLKLEDVGELPAGTYTTLLRFLNKTDMTPDYECEFLFTFIIDDKHSVISHSGEPVIVLTEEDIFNNQSYIKNQNDVRLDLISNTKWKLWLRTSNLDDENCEYYFQLKNVSGKVSAYEQNITRILPNQKYLLASGEPTLEGIQNGNKAPAYITIEYSFKNTNSDNYLKECIRQNPFTYILEME